MSHDKLHHSLRALVASAPPEQPVRVIVQFRRHSPVQRPPLIASLPSAYYFNRLPAAAVELAVNELEALLHSDAVEQVWQDLPVHTMVDVSVPKIQAPRLWLEGHTGRGVKIAFVDTGIDDTHPDFQGRIVAATSLVGRSARDGNGHGTHVASIAAGSGAASKGKYRGVAPEALILAAKVLADDGSGFTSDVMAGIEWAVDQGAQVINLSLGSDEPSDGTDALSALCDQVVRQGIVVCVAAGNMGPKPGTIGTPGCAREVITVGASTDQDEVAPFSSRGPTLDGRRKPDIVCPGEGIVGARAYRTNAGHPLDGRYTEISGTSMATPHASGACALLLEARPDLTPAQIKALMMQHAVNLEQEANAQGAGRLDLYATYRAVVPAGKKPSGCLTSLFHLGRR